MNTMNPTNPAVITANANVAAHTANFLIHIVDHPHNQPFAECLENFT